MKSRLIPLVFFAVGQSILLGIGIGEGFLIHWVIPAIELGPAIVAAEISTIAMAYLFYQVGNSRIARQLMMEEAQEEDEDDYDDTSEEIERLFMQLDRSPLLARSSPSRPKRKRK